MGIDFTGRTVPVELITDTISPRTTSPSRKRLPGRTTANVNAAAGIAVNKATTVHFFFETFMTSPPRSRDAQESSCRYPYSIVLPEPVQPILSCVTIKR